MSLDPHLARAIALAERGWGRVHPNPLVGAVVVKHDEVIGEGWHAEYGKAHAEIAALEQAGEGAQGATLYVSLEPCNHFGQTPPCTDAIINAGIARVVFGASDPNPKARGGASRLQDAGIEVVPDVATDQVRAQNARFFFAVENSATFVTLKYALTLDAMLSSELGTTTNITSAEAVADVHRLRAGFDAIMVGAGTVRIDDPRLTVRGKLQPRVPPVRVILDSNAATPLEANVVRSASETPTWIFCAVDARRDRVEALRASAVRVFTIARAEHGLSLENVLDTLWNEGVRSVLSEGGAELGSALLAQNRVHQLILYYAPTILGRGLPAFSRDVEFAANQQWTIVDVRAIGRDVRLTLNPKKD